MFLLSLLIIGLLLCVMSGLTLYFYFKSSDLRNKLHETQTALALKEQELVMLKDQTVQSSQIKESMLNHAKAAIFEVSKGVSNQLIEDHKRENAESKTQVEATTKKLFSEFSTVLNKVHSLHDQVQRSNNIVDNIKNALLSPSSAGSMAEITLDNLLISSGLIANHDFVTQLHIAGNEGGLRPDAVLFLPDGNLVVVDCKASKFFLEVSESNSDAETAHLQTKLKETMRKHLKDLVRKSYKEAIRTYIEKQYNRKDIRHITTIMFLPTDAALDVLLRIDKEFISHAQAEDIFPCGPVGLMNVLSHTKFYIQEEKRFTNVTTILEECRKLLKAVSSLHEHARKMGVSLQGVVNHYDRFVRSFNSQMLSRARAMEKLGVNLKNKSISQELTSYQMITHESSPVIDGTKDEEIVVEE